MHRIVFLDRSTLRANIRRPAFEHAWTEYPNTPPDRVGERLEGVTIAIVNKARIDRKVLAAHPQIRMIAICATGTDNVDLEACREGGVVVSNIRGYAVHAVPEHAFALILALRRNLLGWREDVRRGLWQNADLFCLFTREIRDLHESTLAVVGSGVLGEAVATLGRAFGMEVLVSERKGAREPRPGRVSFDEALARADVLSLHCPLTPETRHMIGMAELQRMKRDAILINTGRGGLVDEAALAQALREGAIAGAGFDVLSVEPPREGNPLLELDQPNFILTPHVAWASDKAMQTMADQLIDNIEAFARGEPRNRVA